MSWTDAWGSRAWGGGALDTDAPTDVTVSGAQASETDTGVGGGAIVVNGAQASETDTGRAGSWAEDGPTPPHGGAPTGLQPMRVRALPIR